jgi:NADH:ubiquinone oxidoreductase subunit E
MVGEAPTPAQLATPSERATVDNVLLDLPPFERSALLPLLQAVQARAQTLSKGLLGYLGERIHVPFAELYGVASFYALLNTGRPPVRIRLCSGVPCILAGAEQVAHVLGNSDWAWFPCIGQCDRAPAALVGEEVAYALTPSAATGLGNGSH